jgi:hypothetical protein
VPQPPPEPPESIVLSGFTGVKNTVSAERLGPNDLERAINVDLDDAGQPRRRRGYNQRSSVSHHSLRTVGDRTFVVRNGNLGRLREDYSFLSIVADVGIAPVAYTEVNGEVYFSNTEAAGVIDADDVLLPWGKTDGQNRWVSPVFSPTDTLGAIGGRLLGDPVRATCLESYKGRIYLALGKTLWATELYAYHFVDKTKNYMQFEHEITMLGAVDNGIYVGTTGGLYFIQGILGQFKLSQINSDAVLPGSSVAMPSELVHPQARNQPMPSSVAIVFMSHGGVMAGFDNGTCYNLTNGTIEFPQGVSAASLFRQDSGANTYIAAIDAGGAPSANARIGDYVDAEIVRRF